MFVGEARCFAESDSLLSSELLFMILVYIFFLFVEAVASLVTVDGPASSVVTSLSNRKG